MMREPPVKKVLYWCEECNVPLIARRCACGKEGKKIELLRPFDVRPALDADIALIRRLLEERFGAVPLAKILLLNKTGGMDRTELVIMHGERFGWLTFDPVGRCYSFDITQQALPFIISSVKKGIIDLDNAGGVEGGRIGGKRLPLKEPAPDGTAIVHFRGRYGTGVVRDGFIRIRELHKVVSKTPQNPGWDIAVRQNRYHLKNLERNAVRTVRRHLNDRPMVNVSFSGGKDSTAALHIARKAGVTRAFFIDTGIEFPDTVEFVRSQGVEIVTGAGDFWQAAEKAGPPGKDHRWCCKLQKLHPLRVYLARTGPCLTIQGNRWYESWNRADLDETSLNPANPLQLNLSPIRNWRALEVFFYLWWQNAAINPLYNKGLERIGCYVCPAMLESEYEEFRRILPDSARRWDAFLSAWADRKGLPDEYRRWGLWRWRALPPKMRELCRTKGIPMNDDHTLKTGSPRTKPGETTGSVRRMTMEESGEQETGYSVDEIRKDFPILGDFIYLDSAATGFSPKQVIDAMIEFETRYRANVGRGVHRFTRIASQRYWHAHEKVARFIGGTEGVTVFTKNTTEAINMVARGLEWKPGDRVIATILEHHSNLLPWRRLSREGVGLDILGLLPDGSLSLDDLEQAITPSTRLLAVTHASNVTGIVTPVAEIAKFCRDHGILMLIDGAQSVPHIPVDVSRIGCDFFAFSGHKMLGPTGTGVLWMRKPLLEPVQYGGGMVETVTVSGFTMAEGYQKYEAGTPNISGGIGLGVGADYLQKIGMEKVRHYEESLIRRLIRGLQGVKGVTIIAPSPGLQRVGVISFTVEGHHPHEVARYLDETADIMVRSGYHCCQPLMEQLGLPDGTVRASLSLYTTGQEIDLLVATLQDLTSGS